MSVDKDVPGPYVYSFPYINSESRHKKDKARERIHRAMADARLLANPASWGRVADPSPN